MYTGRCEIVFVYQSCTQGSALTASTESRTVPQIRHRTHLNRYGTAIAACEGKESTLAIAKLVSTMKKHGSLAWWRISEKHLEVTQDDGTQE
jgi:hypothetical protein